MVTTWSIVASMLASTTGPLQIGTLTLIRAASGLGLVARTRIQIERMAPTMPLAPAASARAA